MKTFGLLGGGNGADGAQKRLGEKKPINIYVGWLKVPKKWLVCVFLTSSGFA